MRHRQLDPPRPDALCPGRRAAREVDAGLRAPPDLDLLPGEVDAGAERLPDSLLRGEPAGVVLRRVRLGVAVGALRLGEAACLEVLAVPRQRAPDPLDLDQVDADTHAGQGFCSSQSGSCAIDETM